MKKTNKRIILYVATGVMIVAGVVISKLGKIDTSIHEDEMETSSIAFQTEQTTQETEMTEETTEETTIETTIETTSEAQTEPVSEETLPLETESEEDTEEGTEESTEETEPTKHYTVDFEIDWPEDQVPNIVFEKPTNLGETILQMNEHYSDLTYCQIYQYGMSMNTHVGRFIGVEQTQEMVETVLGTYLGYEMVDFSIQLNKEFSLANNCVSWICSCSHTDHYGNTYVDYFNYMQFGDYDVMLLQMIPAGGAQESFNYSAGSLGTVQIVQESKQALLDALEEEE